jgi:hypothetical protein
MRRWRWLLAALLLIVACARPLPSEQRLRWTGIELEGAIFTVRQDGGVFVHVTGSTGAAAADKFAGAGQTLLRQMVRWGRTSEAEALHIWVVPAGVQWPAGLPAPVAGQQARAGAPYALVVREEGQADPRAAGLPEAAALALTQPTGSPAFTVDWLHLGMGAVLAEGWDAFPVRWFRQSEREPLGAELLLAELEAGSGPVPNRQAAAALAAYVMDRWGAAWTAQYPRTPAGLTPEAALLWAAGTTQRADGTARWQARMNQAVGGTYSTLSIVGGQSTVWIPTPAEVSPVRVQPKLAALPPGPGPNANRSPHAYAIAARYEPEERLVRGTEALTWQNGESIPIDTLYFNLWPNVEQYARYGAGIRIESATVDGKAVPYRAQALDLVLPLGRQVAPGERVQVQISFATRLPATFPLRMLGQDGARRFHLVHWFPILAVLDDRGWVLTPLPTMGGEPYSEHADFRVSLDVPEGTVVAATGHQTDRLEPEPGRWIYQYDAPHVIDWVATGGQGLTETVVETEGVTIRAIDSDRSWTGQAAAETARAMALFTERFGPYPYPDLVVACCGGVEFPGLFFTTHVDQPGAWRVTTYHELAHMWFYGAVGNDQYGEAWLDEGFARYGERLAVRAFGPAQALRDLAAQPLPPPLHVTSSSSLYALYGNYALGIYNKGALALEDLEALLGPETFTRLMKEWVRRYQFRTATTAEFMRLSEEVSGRKLDGFFRAHLIDPADR